ncbi:17-beta-hydroxysteroid dehydrogenase 13-like [Asterias rubens]|uniref:17-beta-hydroxysteroid dehydrogenase 13-like n=1 Tax=Asterias rubens TaxID=7604 RepID=UPI001454F645|nr:17-beta-hydroxysteroid dehydrogenase 13-like [Asterias rubens]
MSVFKGISEACIVLGTLLFSFVEVFYRLLVPRSRKSIAGSSVLITGAGHGIGKCMALRFAREKAVLVLWDINQANNEKTAREVRELGAQAFAYTVDCSSPDAVSETAERVIQDLGRVYMLINNAGVLVGEDILNLSEQNIKQTININLMAQFWTIRSFLPAMLEANSGHIVSISSMAGRHGVHRLSDYSASKFAVIGLHESLTDEINQVYRSPGILTTLVCPMFINTGMIHSVWDRATGGKLMDADDVAEEIVDGVLRNKEEIIIPSLNSKLFLFLKAVLPTRGFRALDSFLQVRIPSQASQK